MGRESGSRALRSFCEVCPDLGLVVNNDRPVLEGALVAADVAAVGTDVDRSICGMIEREVLDRLNGVASFSDGELSIYECHEKKPDADDGSGNVVGILGAGLTECSPCEDGASRMASAGMSTYSNVAIAGQVNEYHMQR